MLKNFKTPLTLITLIWTSHRLRDCNDLIGGTNLVIVLLLCEGFGEAKVADFGIVLGDQQHIPSSQVSVDEVMIL